MSASAKIEALLKDAIGLHAPSIGSASVDRAVRLRVAACGAASTDAYWERLRCSRAELQELIEIVVVPETWFSRDREAFAELSRVAREEWRPSRPAAVRRLLSVPCSTGEEPYSMAMAMLDADFSIDRFAIDGVDISERSLAHARLGVYGRNSFRGADIAFRDRYFDAVEHGHRVKDITRRAVRLNRANVLADDFLAGAQPYDAIFCRNLLIYFDEATQQKTIVTLRSLLKDDGLLFVGPAESSALIDQHFVSVKVPHAFAFRKASPKAKPPIKHKSPPRPKVEKRAVPRPPLAPEPAKPASLAPTYPDRMEEAFALADQGRLMEAAAICEEQIRIHGASASAFHLMGLICGADGRLTAANRYYRKALYLDKNHHDALVHLALLLEQQGDPHGASLLLGRAQKIGARA
jgi:chemotaxis protein methyltransferase WspC